jgi:energy-coupling factor transporter ATP-binding protein EcfA2
MTDWAVQIKDLTYYYPNSSVPSLSGINLNIRRGRFVVLMGMNGAGKSSLALCLNGIIPQLLEGKILGEVRVEGKDVRQTRTQSLASTVGLVLQDPESQLIGLTVAEDAAFGPRNLGLEPIEVEKRVRLALATTGLAGYETRPVDTLSGGEKQRLVLAGVLAMRQEVLILDEPASELDPEGRAQLYAVLDQLRREGSRTIIVIEHKLEDIWCKADEVVVLKEGKIAWQGEPSVLCRNLPLLHDLGLKPLAVSRYLGPLVERGCLKATDIPLSVAEVAALLPRLTATKESGGENRPPCLGERGASTANPPASSFLSFLKSLQAYSGEYSLQNSRASGSEQANDPKGTVIIRNLTHRYTGPAFSLDQIDLEIKSGEFVALIGPNGAGKTTLTKHLNGLLKPLQGTVLVSSKNTGEFSTAQLAQVVGYVFQNPDHQLFATTVAKELAFGLKKAGWSSLAVRQRVEAVLQAFELETYREVHPFTLGKNLRQLLTIAVALALKPDILVLDEPTKGLDWPGTQKMLTVLQNLRQAKTTVIAITHDMELAFLADRIIVLKDGRIWRQGPPLDIFTDQIGLAAAGIFPPPVISLYELLKSRVPD